MVQERQDRDPGGGQGNGRRREVPKLSGAPRSSPWLIGALVGITLLHHPHGVDGSQRYMPTPSERITLVRAGLGPARAAAQPWLRFVSYPAATTQRKLLRPASFDGDPACRHGQGKTTRWPTSFVTAWAPLPQRRARPRRGERRPRRGPRGPAGTPPMPTPMPPIAGSGSGSYPSRRSRSSARAGVSSGSPDPPRPHPSCSTPARSSSGSRPAPALAETDALLQQATAA